MTIRPIAESDAESFLALKRKLDSETLFLLMEPGERTTTLPEQLHAIQEVLSQDNSLILVVENQGELVGYLCAMGGKYIRTRHVVYIVMAILQAFTNKGIGTMLFLELEKWAIEKGIHRLELTTMTHNLAAIKLYLKMGFQIEGRKMHSMRINGGDRMSSSSVGQDVREQGTYIDEYYLFKLL